MMIRPYIVGSGRASQAIQKSLLILQVKNPEWRMEAPVQIRRGQSLPDVKSVDGALLVIANPHGLHAQAILDGAKVGFKGILVEKPSCVNTQELEQLRVVRVPVAVCHVYRQMWGIQTLKLMLESGELGDLITIEGRYWQSSAAQRAIENQGKASSWKNDPKLSGGSDTMIDISVHWIDAAAYLVGSTDFKGKKWLSYANAESPHRDTHAQLTLDFANGKRAFASVSKTVHGAPNHFEINLIGSKKSASWHFLSPDEIQMGIGGVRQTLVRKDNKLGSEQSAFHGLGWLEGYIEISRQLILEMSGQSARYPRLSENLQLMDSLFRLE